VPRLDLTITESEQPEKSHRLLGSLMVGDPQEDSLGLAILGAAGVVALQGVELGNFFIALILLGIGWNFGFIGATSMLADSHNVNERGRMQGLNDLLVFGGVTFAGSIIAGGKLSEMMSSRAWCSARSGRSMP